MEYVKTYPGSCISAQIFSSKAELDRHEQEIKDYRSMWADIVLSLMDRGLPVRGCGFGAFCPYQQWFTLSFIKPEDEPRISENGMYVTFKVNMKEGKIEVSQNGHIWLTKADEKASYLCMCGLRAAVEATGRKWFRKSSFKDEDDLAKKVERFFNECCAALGEATEGYPYKQMKINIYAK